MDERQAHRIIEHGCRGKQRLGRRAAVAQARAAGGGMQPYRCLADPTHWHIGRLPSLEGLERLALALRVRSGNNPDDDTDGGCYGAPRAYDQATGTRDRLTSGTRAGSDHGPVD